VTLVGEVERSYVDERVPRCYLEACRATRGAHELRRALEALDPGTRRVIRERLSLLVTSLERAGKREESGRLRRALDAAR
jgi:hypothetical protein